MALIVFKYIWIPMLALSDIFNQQKRPWLILTIFLSALIYSSYSTAQSDYPNRPVKIVVPFGAGGMSDGLTRLFAKELSNKLGQPFVLDFKPGAATNIGAAAVFNSPSDGYTLFVSTMASNALNKWTYKKLAFDPDAFSNVGIMGVVTSFVVVRPESPFKSVEDLIRAAKANPQGLSYGTHGAGGPNHMITELFRSQSGIQQLVHVPYKGLESHVDLMAGRIDFMIDGAAINLVQSGKLRAIAVTYPRRWPTQPNIPTMAEQGYPQVTLSAFFGLCAPPNTPASILEKLNAVMRDVARNPDIEKALLSTNIMPMAATRQETTDFIKQQSEKWGPILKSLNISFD
ncbi:MAG: tripartite tricarboxylate transporter substrate binding protein [Betaproteobacteria bacterium]